MLKPFRLLVAASVAVAMVAVPSAANASHCGNPVLLFSRTTVAHSDTKIAYNAVNHHAATCLADSDHEVSGGFLAPGANELRVRWTGAISDADYKDFVVILDGLGFDGVELRLVKDDNVQGGASYQTPFVAIPGGPTAQGEVTATVVEPDGFESTATYSTFGS